MTATNVILYNNKKSKLSKVNPAVVLESANLSEIIELRKLLADDKIAFAYERANVIELANMICVVDKNDLLVKKNSKSPLFTNVQGDSVFARKIKLIETALYSIVESDKANISQVNTAYKVLTLPKKSYKLSGKLLEMFRVKLGLNDRIERNNQIISKLKELGEELGFTSL